MTFGSIERARGRPRDPAKRATLLASARDLFLQLGPDAVTVDRIVAAAGVSRATFYLNFADKNDLLAAVIAQESQRIVRDDWIADHADEDLHQLLTEFGIGLLELLADPDTMRFEQLILHVTQSRPEVGPAFFAAGPGRARAALGQMIASGRERGELHLDDIEQAANDLIGLWQGGWRVEVLYGNRPPPDAEEIGRRARHGVEVFMTLHSCARAPRP